MKTCVCSLHWGKSQSFTTDFHWNYSVATKSLRPTTFIFRTKSAGLTSRCWCDLFIFFLSFFFLFIFNANIVTRLYKRDHFLQHKWHVFLKRRESTRRGETEATFQLTSHLTAKNIKSTKGETSNDVMSEYVHAWALLTFQTCDPCTSLEDFFFVLFYLLKVFYFSLS